MRDRLVRRLNIGQEERKRLEYVIYKIAVNMSARVQHPRSRLPTPPLCLKARASLSAGPGRL